MPENEHCYGAQLKQNTVGAMHHKSPFKDCAIKQKSQ